ALSAAFFPSIWNPGCDRLASMFTRRGRSTTPKTPISAMTRTHKSIGAFTGSSPAKNFVAALPTDWVRFLATVERILECQRLATSALSSLDLGCLCVCATNPYATAWEVNEIRRATDGGVCVCARRIRMQCAARSLLLGKQCLGQPKFLRL